MNTILVAAKNLRLADVVRRGSQRSRVTGIAELTTGTGAKLVRISTVAIEKHPNFADGVAITCSPKSFWHLEVE